MTNDINNLPETRALPEAIGHPADGFTPTPEVSDKPTDDACAPEALHRLTSDLCINVGGKMCPWSRCEPEDRNVRRRHDEEDRRRTCRVHVPVDRDSGNLSVTRFWIGNAVYVRDDVMETIEDYPKAVLFDDHFFYRSHPLRTAHWTSVRRKSDGDDEPRRDSPDDPRPKPAARRLSGHGPAASSTDPVEPAGPHPG